MGNFWAGVAERRRVSVPLSLGEMNALMDAANMRRASPTLKTAYRRIGRYRDARLRAVNRAQGRKT